MAVKRDYGSFAKASVKALSPLVESLGYRPWYGGGFGRERTGWVDGFFLQQSAWGSGDFSVTVGIHVPGLDQLWAIDRATKIFGLLIAWRLSDSADEQGAERWYHAKDRDQLQTSLATVATTLAKADSWFQRFNSLADIVVDYRIRSGLPKDPSGDFNVSCVINYGLLLKLIESANDARRWLRFADGLVSRPVFWDAVARVVTHEQRPGLKLIKPGKDDELRRKVIHSALTSLGL